MTEVGTGRSIRTYKPRRGRVTPRQARALAQAGRYLASPTDRLEWDDYDDIVLEIGFGTGEATSAMAAAEPATGILAVDIHTPGIGDLLHRIDELGLGNVRVIDGDALDVLELVVPPGRLAGVRTFFPDPWPKARHHKRRLVSPATAELVATRVRPGGFWHLATDWAAYADVMVEVVGGSPSWSGGPIERPGFRPVTRYERAGLAHGREVVDLWFERVVEGAAG